MRYLGIKIDENLNWKIYIHDLTSKLNRANAVLAKLRHFLNSENLRSIYFAIFHSHLNYVCISWGLTRFPQQKVSILQKFLQGKLTVIVSKKERHCFYPNVGNTCLCKLFLFLSYKYNLFVTKSKLFVRNFLYIW